MKNLKITYFGVLKSITSWSKVSRELILSLLKLGVDLNIYERKGFLYDTSFPLDYTIKSRINNNFEGGIVFTFENPRVYHYLPEECLKIGFLVYEFNELPKIWIENINKYLDMVIVPSVFTRDVFVNSGIDAAKVKILRFGFNPAYYFTEKKSKKNDVFTFLCCSAPHKREGIELLLESYTKTFSKNDRVQLILKLTYIPGANYKEFEYRDINDLINSFKKRKNAPKISVISKILSEQQMSDLYQKANCYFSMVKAESFGLCFLEALACGLEIACINYSGQSDFLNDNNAHFINYSMKPLNGEEYESLKRKPLIPLPEINHASDVIRNVYETSRKKNNPETDLSYYYWDNVARDFLSIIREFDKNNDF
ncbi:MAG: glycosyltransferase [Elusimicrobia bacterium]|nr:glycosyltransferase [Candidatus Liberimonas magnetica]